MIKSITVFCLLTISLINDAAGQSKPPSKTSIIAKNREVLRGLIDPKVNTFPRVMAMIANKNGDTQLVMLLNTGHWYSAPGSDLKPDEDWKWNDWSRKVRSFELKLDPRRLYDLRQKTQLMTDLCDGEPTCQMDKKRVLIYRMTRDGQMKHFLGVPAQRKEDTQPVTLNEYDLTNFEPTGQGNYGYRYATSPFYKIMSEPNEFSYFVVGYNNVWWARLNFISNTIPTEFNDEFMVSKQEFAFVFDTNNTVCSFYPGDGKTFRVMPYRVLKEPDGVTVDNITYMVNETDRYGERAMWAAMEEQTDSHTIDKLMTVDEDVKDNAKLIEYISPDYFVNGPSVPGSSTDKDQETGESRMNPAYYIIPIVLGAILFFLCAFFTLRKNHRLAGDKSSMDENPAKSKIVSKKPTSTRQKSSTTVKSNRVSIDPKRSVGKATQKSSVAKSSMNTAPVKTTVRSVGNEQKKSIKTLPKDVATTTSSSYKQ